MIAERRNIAKVRAQIRRSKLKSDIYRLGFGFVLHVSDLNSIWYGLVESDLNSISRGHVWHKSCT